MVIFGLVGGSALLGGFSIASQPVECRRLMGYCPQFDAVHELLTGNETLELYGRIRGIPEGQLRQMVAYLVDRLDLKKYCNRPAGTYSGHSSFHCHLLHPSFQCFYLCSSLPVSDC